LSLGGFLLVLFVGHVAAYCATRCCTQNAVATGHMAAHTADHCAFKASFCARNLRRVGNGQEHCEGTKTSFHDGFLK
jgi:hypothetical protein